MQNHRQINNQGIIYQQQRINSGEYITSPNQQYFLAMQHDGNLVLYTNPSFQPNYAVWSSQTHGKGQAPYHCIPQQDGNFVVYDRNNSPLWASNTYGKGIQPYSLRLQDDRNLVLYDQSATATWSSNTYQAPGSQPQQQQTFGNQFVNVTVTHNNNQTPQNINNNGQRRQQFYGGHIQQEQQLNEGEYMASPCNKFFLTMQRDGNLVLYTDPSFQSNYAIWSSNTYGKGQGPYKAKVQSDGNFVVYDRNLQPTWASDTWQKGQGPYRLTLQSDRNLVLYDRNNTATWSSNTYQAPGTQQPPISFQQQQYNPPQQQQQFHQPPGAQNFGGQQQPNGVRSHHQSGKIPCQGRLENEQYIQSNDGKNWLKMQQDGNLVLYNHPSFQPQHAVWSSNTWGKGQGPYHAVVQADGNFVVYDRNQQPTWASDTWQKGRSPHYLVLQFNELRLYDADNMVQWKSA